jgi:hypothetical protein
MGPLHIGNVGVHLAGNVSEECLNIWLCQKAGLLARLLQEGLGEQSVLAAGWACQN